MPTVPMTDFDEQLVHQVPEPLANVATRHEHWRESYFFVTFPREPTPASDVLILTMATYPFRQVLDSYQMGRVDGVPTFALHERPWGDSPHQTVVGPVEIEIVEPYKRVNLHVAPAPNSPVSLDMTFSARGAACGLRRGTMRWRDETVWDQSHMIQSGNFDGTYTFNGDTRSVDGWWGQRDHSWGIRDHFRCPMWMWVNVQLEDEMLGAWHWEYANGAPVYTDGCAAPSDGSPPVSLVSFHHEMNWTDHKGQRVDYGRDGEEVRGLEGVIEMGFENGRRVRVEGQGELVMPYAARGGGQYLLRVQTDDGRKGCAIFEITGAHHHRYFPVARAERLPPG